MSHPLKSYSFIFCVILLFYYPIIVVSDSAGVKTQFANVVAALVSLSVILWLLPLFSYMPRATTASIIFVVACNLIEREEIFFVFRVRKWMDAAMLIGMYLATFFLGVDIGVLMAFAACLLLAVKQTTLPGVTMLGRGYANDDFHDLQDVDETVAAIEGILIYKIDGALYFANAEKMKESTKRAETQGGFHIHPAEEPHPMAITSVVFDLSSLTSVDSSALSILLDIVRSYRSRNARVIFVKLRRDLRIEFERAGILEVIGRENCYRKIEKAVEDIQKQNLSNLTHIQDTEEQTILPTDATASDSSATYDPSSPVPTRVSSAPLNVSSPIPTSVPSSPSVLRKEKIHVLRTTCHWLTIVARTNKNENVMKQYIYIVHNE